MKKLAVLAALVLLLSACDPTEEPPPIVAVSTSPSASPSVKDEPDVTALRIGTVDVGKNEFRYLFYGNVQDVVNTYGPTGDYGFDPEKPLESQRFDDEQSWFDVFRDETVDELRAAVMMSEEAERAGMKLNALYTQQVDDEIERLRLVALKDNVTLDALLRERYGGTVSEDDARRALTRQKLAAQFIEYKREEASPTLEEIEKYYEENADDFDEVSFRRYAFYAEMDEDAATVLDDAAAREAAQKFYDAIKSETTYVNYVAGKLEADPEDTEVRGIPDQEADGVTAWLYDPTRKTGDKAVIEAEGTFFVLYFRGRYKVDEIAVAVRHILITENGNLSDAHVRAQEIYDKWQEGAADEESFAALARAYSEDFGSSNNGGLYDDIVKDGKQDPAFEEWCFDKNRKYGDTDLVDASYGTHIMFFKEKAEYWQNTVRDALQEKTYDEYLTKIEKLYPVELLDLKL
ncbi:hypothetical protein FACS1894202_12510 [Clostridia bacterium]|nr:hypothetical protein FACS1894202_12510 [Clostridia bacterium]